MELRRLTLLAIIALAALLMGQGYNVPFRPRMTMATDYRLHSDLIAWWSFDEASNSTRVAGAGSCADAGSTCDLVDFNTVPVNRTSPFFVEGTGSADFDASEGEMLFCGSQDCQALYPPSAFTLVAWAWLDTLPDIFNGIFNTQDATGGYGFSVFGVGDVDALHCSVSDGISASEIEIGATKLTTSAFGQHIACSYDEDGDDEIKVYLKGKEDCSAPGCDTISDLAYHADPGTRANFKIGRDVFGHNGEIDDVAVFGVQLAADDICKICSCGMDGERCRCFGETYFFKPGNAFNCQSCTLPAACNEVLP